MPITPVRYAVLSVCGLLAAAGPVAGFLWPELNWDMLAYTGIAHLWLGADPLAAHAAAYEDAATFARSRGLSALYDALVHGSSYRQTLANDPEAFGEVLRFYNLRPLYEACVVALGASGINIAAATVLVSSLSVLAANLAVLFHAVRTAGLQFGALLFAGFALSPPILTVAGYSSADALGTALVGFGAMAWLGGRPRLGAAIFLASVGVRTDFALTNLMVAAVLLLAHRRGMLQVPGVSLVLLVLSYPLARTIEYANGAYPFLLLYYNTFVAWLPHPAHPGAISVPARRFATALFWGVMKGAANGAYAWPLVPALGIRVLPCAVFAGAFLAALLVRTVLFPEPDIRLVAPIFAAVYMAFISSYEKKKEAVLF